MFNMFTLFVSALLTWVTHEATADMRCLLVSDNPGECRVCNWANGFYLFRPPPPPMPPTRFLPYNPGWIPAFNPLIPPLPANINLTTVLGSTNLSNVTFNVTLWNQTIALNVAKPANLTNTTNTTPPQNPPPQPNATLSLISPPLFVPANMSAGLAIFAPLISGNTSYPTNVTVPIADWNPASVLISWQGDSVENPVPQQGFTWVNYTLGLFPGANMNHPVIAFIPIGNASAPPPPADNTTSWRSYKLLVPFPANNVSNITWIPPLIRLPVTPPPSNATLSFMNNFNSLMGNISGLLNQTNITPAMQGNITQMMGILPGMLGNLTGLPLNMSGNMTNFTLGGPQNQTNMTGNNSNSTNNSLMTILGTLMNMTSQIMGTVMNTTSQNMTALMAQNATGMIGSLKMMVQNMTGVNLSSMQPPPALGSIPKAFKDLGPYVLYAMYVPLRNGTTPPLLRPNPPNNTFIGDDPALSLMFGAAGVPLQLPFPAIPPPPPPPPPPRCECSSIPGCVLIDPNGFCQRCDKNLTLLNNTCINFNNLTNIINLGNITNILNVTNLTNLTNFTIVIGRGNATNTTNMSGPPNPLGMPIPPLIIDLTNITRIINLTNCRILNTTGQCIECDPGFVPTNSSCAPLPMNLTNNTNIINVTNTSQLNVLAGGCAIFADAGGRCLYCAHGWFSWRGKCFVLPPKCRGSTGIRCTRCAAGFSLIPNAKPIDSAVFEGARSAIDFGNFASGNFLCKDNTIPGCEVYLPGLDPSSPIRCSQCQKGFFSRSATVCEAVQGADANCVKYSSAATCAECLPGMYPSGRVCVSFPKNVAIPNCYSSAQLGNGTIVCEKCNSNAYPDSGNCTNITTSAGIQNCLYYRSLTECDLCAADYFVFNGTCKLRVPTTVTNCLAYDANGTCSRCSAANVQIGGLCFAVNTTVPNCLEHQADGNCSVCLDQFVNVNGECQPFQIPNCLYFSPGKMSTCATCQPGYTRLANGTCLVSSDPANPNPGCLKSIDKDCVMCEANYVLVTVGGQTRCSSSATACKYRDANGGCRTCMNGLYYDLTTDSCISPNTITGCVDYLNATACLICQPTKYPVNGNCVDVPVASVISNCAVYSPFAECRYCAVGYRPTQIGRKVIACNTIVSGTEALNCAFQGTQSFECALCLGGFRRALSVGSGVRFECKELAAPIPGCLVQAKGAGFCKICQEGQIPDKTQFGQACVNNNAVPQNCALVDGANVCVICSTGFVLNPERQCLPVIIPNCTIHDGYRRCARCVDGQVPIKNGTSCGPAMPNCLTSSPDGSCIQCAANFFTTPKTCYPYNPPSCKFFRDRARCAECGIGFGVDQAGICVAASAPLDCAAYLSTQNCTRCRSDKYRFLDGSCQAFVTTIPNCSIYTSATACSGCVAPYYASSGKCVQSAKTIDGCQLYIGNSTCGKCGVNSTLTKINSCLNNCEVPTDAGLCSRCAPTYYPDSTGHCSSIGVAAINFCRYYNSSRSCVECMKGSFLVNGTCVQEQILLNDPCEAALAPTCSMCEKGYAPDEFGQCQIADDTYPTGCLLLDLDDRCLVCDTDFYMSGPNRQCLKLDPTLAKCKCNWNFPTSSLVTSTCSALWSL